MVAAADSGSDRVVVASLAQAVGRPVFVSEIDEYAYIVHEHMIGGVGLKAQSACWLTRSCGDA